MNSNSTTKIILSVFVMVIILCLLCSLFSMMDNNCLLCSLFSITDNNILALILFPVIATVLIYFLLGKKKHIFQFSSSLGWLLGFIPAYIFSYHIWPNSFFGKGSDLFFLILFFILPSLIISTTLALSLTRKNEESTLEEIKKEETKNN